MMKQEIQHIDLNSVNCYLVKTEKGFVLFDTGGHIIMDKEFTNRRQELIDQLEKAGCKPGDLKAIILTHGDCDHAANAAFLRDHYHTIIAMHTGDTGLVWNVTLDKMMESFQYSSLVLKIVFRLMKKKISQITETTRKDFDQFQPDMLLKDGDDLSAYGLKAKTVHLPGHTNGSIGILFEDGQFICGDIFANIKKPSLSPNALDFKQLKESVRKIKAMNISTFYPGHGKPFAAAELK